MILLLIWDHLKGKLKEWKLQTFAFCFQELNAQKQEMMQLEYDKGKWNNLLEYLRSLDPNMVMARRCYLICIPLQLKVVLLS